MKRTVLYYFLILLLVMGGFAAMALNSYGVPLISAVSLFFGLVFWYEFVFSWPRQSNLTGGRKISLGIELFSLGAIGILYFLKGIVIEIPFNSQLKLIFFLLIWMTNVFHFYQEMATNRNKPFKIKASVALYFASLLLLLVSNYASSAIVQYGSLIALILLILFGITGWWNGKVIVDGEETTGLTVVSNFKNKSGVQLILVALIAGYSLLSSFRVLPPLYNGSLPNGYNKVTQQWNESRQSSTNPDQFETAYRKFLEGK
ncbi:MAG TPA: hypothetical protein PLR06_04045 [Cyclobacteriaceae bacterium]|nr:hypothetical protein [Cyclobacteriaceae bacterium]